MEFARMVRMKRRLARLKTKVKEHASKNDAITLPTETVRVTSEPIKVRTTYKVLDRVEEDGWPMFLLQRNDGKKRTVNAAKFRQLDKSGKILGFVPAPPVNEKFQKARTPRGQFAIQVGAEGWRVDIVYSISSDWKDLMCYDHKLHRMMHYKREDLYPKENVNEAIAFLKGLDETERLAQKPEKKPE
jgi:hypothetical protein